jgi:peptidylprolyl isomerase
MILSRRFLLAAAFAAGLAGAAQAQTQITDPENTLIMELKTGEVIIQMRPDLAPNHVAQIKKLTREGFYNNTPFHRVIPGFMVQGGDPTGRGTGGSGNKLKAEFSSERHVRGVTSMARAQDPNSADSQFFIMLGTTPSLDGQYTVWGRVIDGMQHVDAIRKGKAEENGIVPNPDRIISLRVASDAKK